MRITLFLLLSSVFSFNFNKIKNLHTAPLQLTNRFDGALLNQAMSKECHNGDYDLATPDSLAFDDVCFLENKYYSGSGFTGYLKYSKNNNNFYAGCDGAIFVGREGTRIFSISGYEYLFQYDFLNYLHAISGKEVNLISGSQYNIDIDSLFMADDILFSTGRQAAEISNTLDSYIPYNASEKPNFLRIVSYDPITSILKARFRITFQVINPFDGNKYIGATLGGIGKKRYAKSPDFVTLDDGVIHIYLKQY